MTPQTIPELLEWQWKGYAQYHVSKFNLLLHIACVPLFLWGNVALVVSLFKGQWMGVVASAVTMLVAFFAQGLGHKFERTAAVPFSSFSNAIKRVFLEQWFTFPKFVISGLWLKALKNN